MADIIKESLRHSASHSHSEESINSSATVTAKAVTMVCLFTASFVFGVTPIKLSQWFNWHTNQRSKATVMLFLCFGGGVLMCTTFLHLLPEVTEEIEELTEEGLFPESIVPIAHFLMCMGFFLMYFVEECVHVYLHKREKNHAMKAFNRTLSIRRGEIGSTEEMNSSSNLVKKDIEKGEKAPQVCYNDHHSEQHNHVGHSHIIVEDDTVATTIRGLLIVLALSVHELFEGLAVGLENSAATVWYMFGAVAAHKFVIAFCIGVELVSKKTKTCYTIIYVFTFAVVSPMGIGIGILVSTDNPGSTHIVAVILQGLATGTLLYVVFFEILQKDKIYGLKSYFAIVLGFAVMFGLTIFATDQENRASEH